MTVVSGYEISEISMFFADYKYTDHLLTHEDDLQNRVIAYVYYLNRHRLNEFIFNLLESSKLARKAKIGPMKMEDILKLINQTPMISQSVYTSPGCQLVIR